MTNPTLTYLQETFLTACLTEGKSLQETMTKHAVRPVQFATWMTDSAFTKRLTKLQKEIVKRRGLALQLGATAAADTLDQIASGELEAKTVQRQACVDLVRLARDLTARKRAQAKPSQRFYEDLYHPELGRERAVELARELEGNPPSDV